MQQPPQDYISSLQNVFIDFVWQDRHWFKTDRLYLHILFGGLNILSRLHAFRDLFKNINIMINLHVRQLLNYAISVTD